MTPWLVRLLTFAIPGLIVAVGLVAWGIILTGDWPPRFLLISRVARRGIVAVAVGGDPSLA